MSAVRSLSGGKGDMAEMSRNDVRDPQCQVSRRLAPLSEPIKDLIGPEPLKSVQCLVENAKLLSVDAPNLL